MNNTINDNKNEAKLFPTLGIEETSVLHLPNPACFDQVLNQNKTLERAGSSEESRRSPVRT